MGSRAGRQPGVWSGLPRELGRRAFGGDPPAYDAARPPYPEALYDLLAQRCGLGPASRIFEIGPGTGIATRALLRRGAGSVTLVEPDPRLARWLRGSLRPWAGRVTIVNATFEQADLEPAGFDLGVSATAFHWLAERSALRKVARLLRPGGWWAAWWNVYGDPARRGPLHRALDPLYDELEGRGRLRARWEPFQMNRRDRELALRRNGRFRRILSTVYRRTLPLGTAEVVALYATYGSVVSLPPERRAWFLGELTRIVEERFAGRVAFRVLTPLYVAQRLGPSLRPGRPRPERK